MMKTQTLLLAAFASLALSARSELTPIPRISGRIQYEKNPGQGPGAMKFIDNPLPQGEVRVGPTRQEGVALGFLMAFRTTPDFRQHMVSGKPIELVLDVKGTSRSGAPDELKVALLNMGSGDDPQAFVQFGAWNNAADFAEVGSVDADPDAGVIRFDVARALSHAERQPSPDSPVIWFAVYLPAESIEGPEGRHVIFAGAPVLRVRP